MSFPHYELFSLTELIRLFLSHVVRASQHSSNPTQLRYAGDVPAL